MGFGRWIGAATALVVMTAILEHIDMRYAWWFAIITLLALFLGYPTAADEIRKMLGL